MKLFYIEILALIIILLYQAKAYLTTTKTIQSLKDLYPNKVLDKSNLTVIESQDTFVEQVQVKEGVSPDFSQILAATNAYLRNNKGSADFNIIKSISERVSDSKESEIASTVTLPLYLGLMGTFIGVILGLVNILFTGSDKILEGDTMGQAINGLLSGVGIAMVVSFVGLALTTYSNAILLKEALAVRNRNKNHYYSFLQSELLPNLDNNLFSVLNSLKENVNGFNTAFSSNLRLFDQNFGNNIKLLKSAIADISSQIGDINQNTRSQIDFLQEIRQLDYKALAKSNISMLKELKNTAPTLTEFIKEHQSFNTNLQVTDAFVDKIAALMSRVSTFEENINGLGRDIQQSEMLGSEVITLVRRQLAAIDTKETLISEYAAKSYSDVQKYLSNASLRVNELKRKIEIDFEHAFDFKAEGNLMQNLNFLKSISAKVDSINKDIKTIANGKLQQAIEGNQASLVNSQSQLLDNHSEAGTDILVKNDSPSFTTISTGQQTEDSDIQDQDTPQEIESPEATDPESGSIEKRSKGFWKRIFSRSRN